MEAAVRPEATVEPAAAQPESNGEPLSAGGAPPHSGEPAREDGREDARPPDWYPGCPESLGLSKPVEPNPMSNKSQKSAKRRRAAQERRLAAAEERSAARLRLPEGCSQREVHGGDTSCAARPAMSAPSVGSCGSLEAARLRKALVREEEIAKFTALTEGAPTICIDCEWDAAISAKQIGSLARELGRCYGSNRRAERPFRLVFSGVRKGSRTDVELHRIDGYEGWARRMRVAEEPYIRLFPSSRLVYLSPDGAEVLTSFDDPEAVYIIGGIVDSSRLAGKTKLKADLQGIASARLPIMEYARLTSSHDAVLAVNHVFDIALALRHGRSWSEAVEAYVPLRKQRRRAYSGGSGEEEAGEARGCDEQQDEGGSSTIAAAVPASLRPSPRGERDDRGSSE